MTSETLLTTKSHSNGTDYLTIILQITVRRGWVRVLVGAVPSKSKKSWRRKTYHTCLRLSYHRNHCRSRIASGQARSGCFYSGTGKAHTSAHLYKNTYLAQVSPHRQHLLSLFTFQNSFLTTLLLGFIRRVPAVILSVTLPSCRDAAARVLAAELIHTACHLSCNRGD